MDNLLSSLNIASPNISNAGLGMGVGRGLRRKPFSVCKLLSSELRGAGRSLSIDGVLPPNKATAARSGIHPYALPEPRCPEEG